MANQPSQRKLEEAKKKLTDEQREVIHHAFYEDPDQTQAEMAEKMNCSQSMVHKHLDTALKNLRKGMGL
ncbi:sigma factor-like helix-turn-helix DNA-binding protein [Fusicatenibacter sp.]